MTRFVVRVAIAWESISPPLVRLVAPHDNKALTCFSAYVAWLIGSIWNTLIQA